MASSPPAEPNYPNMGSFAFNRRAHDEVKPLTPTRSDANRASRTLSETPSVPKEQEKPRQSNVRVLPTSLPHVHHELMLLREKARADGSDPNEVLHPLQLDATRRKREQDTTSPIPEEIKDAEGNPIYRSKEEQEATRSALKPHSRSVTQLAAITVPKPEALTSLPVIDDRKTAPKIKPRKWQFGIRSRNQPWEATKCLYDALVRSGATWNIIPATQNDGQNGDEDGSGTPIELASGEQHKVLQYKYPEIAEDYYIPHDMNYIEARILKRGMHIPGDQHCLSASSSAISLPSEAKSQLKKHIQQLGHNVSEDMEKILGIKEDTKAKAKSPLSSEQSSRPQSSFGDQGTDAFTGPGQPMSRPESLQGIYKHLPSEHVGVYVYMTIQLYQIESGVFVVDFKCDGYVNIVWSDKKAKSKSPNSDSTVTSPDSSRPASGLSKEINQPPLNDGHSADSNEHGEWVPVSKRYRNVEKEVTSPYPFLDVASDLVASLASQPT